MTFAKFFGLGFTLAVLAAAAKILFLNVLNPESGAVLYGFWFFMVLFTVACVRRLGVIQYLEASLVIITWFGIIMVVDLIVVAPVAGIRVFTTLNIWIANLIILASIWLFHKKRHVQIRKEHAKHSAHH